MTFNPRNITSRAAADHFDNYSRVPSMVNFKVEGPDGGGFIVKIAVLEICSIGCYHTSRHDVY